MYVQDRLRQASGRVWQLLQAGGHFYVCGDAGGMATAVQQALLDIIAEHQVCILAGRCDDCRHSSSAPRNLPGMCL